MRPRGNGAPLDVGRLGQSRFSSVNSKKRRYEIDKKSPKSLYLSGFAGFFEVVVREGFEPPNGKPNGFTVHAL